MTNSISALTPEEIYEIVKGKDKAIGIEGYICPKKHFDYHDALWRKKRTEILQKNKSAWPPESWKSNKETGVKEPPKRINFIDEQIKLANSFTNPSKSQEIKEALEAKGHKFDNPNPYKSDFDKKPNKKNLLSEFRKREDELKKIREQIKAIPEYKQNAIEEVKAKLENQEHKPKHGKSNWSKCERIMFSEDNRYLGEQVPFWNPNKKEENKKKAEFFPNKIKFMKKSPTWSFPSKKVSESALQIIKDRDERLEEKANAVLEKMGIDRKKYIIDPLSSYNKIRKMGRYHIFLGRCLTLLIQHNIKLRWKKENVNPLHLILIGMMEKEK